MKTVWVEATPQQQRLQQRCEHKKQQVSEEEAHTYKHEQEWIICQRIFEEYYILAHVLRVAVVVAAAQLFCP